MHLTSACSCRRKTAEREYIATRIIAVTFTRNYYNCNDSSNYLSLRADETRLHKRYENLADSERTKRREKPPRAEKEREREEI